MSEPFDHFARAIRHHAAGEMDAAREAVAAAAEAAPDETLYTDAQRYLDWRSRHGQQHIYARADAFSAFVSGGSNLPLYDHARERLGARLAALSPARVLDIGCGEGTTIVPVIEALDPQPHLTLVEPSLALLDRALEFSWARGLEPSAYPYPIEKILPHLTPPWEVAIATWSIHNLTPESRAELLKQLAGMVGSLLVVEFDDRSTAFDDPLDEARIRHVHDRYRAGLAEYPGRDGERVRLGFLLPVMFGYFESGEARSTHEQTIDRWEAELATAGFELVARERIYSYWWADAYLIEARGRAGT